MELYDDYYDISLHNTTTNAQTTMVIFDGLKIWSPYRVRVLGVNEAGPGVFSTTVMARTPFGRKYTMNAMHCGASLSATAGLPYFHVDPIH